jgi:hypothetical protein
VVRWDELRTPLGLPGQRQAVATRTSFVALREQLPPKPAETRFYATSARVEDLEPSHLKRLAREHWKIENSLHHVKDRTWLEDRHWIGNRRTGVIVTMLRSVACCLVRRAKGPALKRRGFCPARIEYFNQNPRRAFKLLTSPLRL